MLNKKTFFFLILCFFSLAVVALGIIMYIQGKMRETAYESTAVLCRITAVYIVPIIVAALLFLKAYIQKEIAVRTSIITDAVCVVLSAGEFVFASIKLGGMSHYLLTADKFPILMMTITAFLISLVCDFVRLHKEKLPD